MKVTARKKVWLPKENLAFEKGETKELQDDEALRERIAGDPLFIIEDEGPATAPVEENESGEELQAEETSDESEKEDEEEDN